MTTANLFTDLQQVEKFLFAGNATITVVSKVTGKHLTLKFRRPKKVEAGQPVPTWASVLTTSDNTAPGAFIGTVWGDHGQHDLKQSKKSAVGPDAPSTKAVRWVLAALDGKLQTDPLEQAEFWHEGKCGRCGRLLTTPTSIAMGIGPECAKHF